VNSTVSAHDDLEYLAYACVHHPIKGNFTLGKLAMARRDSLQDFETTPRPLLFARLLQPSTSHPKKPQH
jgi:hypothetical protein